MQILKDHRAKELEKKRKHIRYHRMQLLYYTLKLNQMKKNTLQHAKHEITGVTFMSLQMENFFSGHLPWHRHNQCTGTRSQSKFYPTKVNHSITTNCDCL